MSTKRHPKVRAAKGAKIELGDIDVPDEAFSPEATRLRISILIPGDVLAMVKERAKTEGLPYQTFINQLLRSAVMGDNSIHARIQRLEKAVAGKR